MVLDSMKLSNQAQREHLDLRVCLCLGHWDTSDVFSGKKNNHRLQTNSAGFYLQLLNLVWTDDLSTRFSTLDSPTSIP